MVERSHPGGLKIEAMIIRITKDRDGGFRLQLVDGINRVDALMQSRKHRDQAEARRDARRLFGPLEWQEPLKAGCQLDFVEAVAQVIAMPLKPEE